MSYFPGHNYFLRFSSADNTSINDTTGAVSVTSALGTAVDIGYTSPNGVESNEGTKVGYAAGRRTGSYTARGNRVHTLTAELKLGSLDFIKDNCVVMGDDLPWLDFYFGVSGEWANALYLARCSKVSLEFTEEEAKELTASATFEATARAEVSPITLNYSTNSTFPASCE